MKTITYNPETHVLVPREPSEEMCDAATADSCWENMNPPPSTAYRLMIAAAPQPEPNRNWCAGCSPDNCSGCGAEPVAYTAPQPDRTAELEQLRQRVAELEEENTALVKTIQRDTLTSLRRLAEKDEVIAELEAVLKVAREGIYKFLVANNSTEFDCACDLSVGYLCGPCRADMQQEPLKIALAKINEVLE